MRFSAASIALVCAALPLTAMGQDRWTSGTPSRLCNQPDREPQVVNHMRIERVFGTARPWTDFYGQAAIEIRVSTDGTVSSARYIVMRLTPSLERGVFREARRMQFQPALRSCRPVVGTYTARVIIGDPFDEVQTHVRASPLRAEDRASGLRPAEILDRLVRAQQ